MSKPKPVVPPLTPAVMRLAAVLLEQAPFEFSNHGCNDFDLSAVHGFEDARGARSSSVASPSTLTTAAAASDSKRLWNCATARSQKLRASSRYHGLNAFVATDPAV